MRTHQWEITAQGTYECKPCGVSIDTKEELEKLDEVECVPQQIQEIRDRIPKRMSDDEEAALMVRVLTGEIQSAADFVKLHHTAAYVKDYDERTKQERKRGIAMKKAWNHFIGTCQTEIVELLNTHGHATESGGRSLSTAAGLSYLKTRKETTCRLLDEEEVIKVLVRTLIGTVHIDEDNSLSENLLHRIGQYTDGLAKLKEEGLVEMVPKLTDEGKERAKAFAIKQCEETGEILTDDAGEPIVDIKLKGSQICVTTTKPATVSTRLAGARLLPRPEAALTNEDDDDE